MRKNKETEKPGVMVYFDVKNSVDLLSDQEAGILFRAILNYGLNGTEDQLDGSLSIIWPMIRARLDIDDQRYRDTIEKRQYANYVRRAKVNGEEAMDFEDWLASVAQLERQEAAGMFS